MPKLTSLSLCLTGSLFSLALAGAATAGPAYRWTAADGSIQGGAGPKDPRHNEKIKSCIQLAVVVFSA